MSEFETLDEYKADVKAKLEKTKEETARRTKEEEAIAKIVEKSAMDIPEAMIRTQEDNMINEMAQNMARQGLSMDQYFQFTGTTLEQLREQVRPDAENRIKNSLVLEAIAKEQNFEITDADIDEEIKKMAEQYKMKFEDLNKNIRDSDRESIREDLKIQKAVDFVMDNAKERAKAKKKAAADKEESDKED